MVLQVHIHRSCRNITIFWRPHERLGRCTAGQDPNWEMSTGYILPKKYRLIMSDVVNSIHFNTKPTIADAFYHIYGNLGKGLGAESTK